jgi:nitrogen fixation NifU-like protein
MDDLRELYQEVIIDHSRHPRNFAELQNATHYAEGFNRLCGDKLNLYLHVKNNVIEEISFKGTGCAISTASASLMTEQLRGKTLEQAEQLFNAFHTALTAEQIPSNAFDQLGKLAVFMGVHEFPARVKCATLAWHTLHAALIKDSQAVSTEETDI